jgi:hypothetical protein
VTSYRPCLSLAGRVVLAEAVLAIACAAALAAQATRPTFEVASVKKWADRVFVRRPEISSRRRAELDPHDVV